MTDAPEPADAPAEPTEEKPSEERAWWDNPGMPWRHKPTKQDLWCWTAITLYGVWGLVMLPLRPTLLTVPFVSAVLNGSRAAVVAIGAITAVRPDPARWWLWTLILASLSMVKFDWIFWWAGKLWGKGIIEIWGGKSDRARRFSDQLIGIANRHPFLSIFVTYLPIPFTPVIYAALGAAGMRLRTYLLIDWFWAALFDVAYFWLGYKIGQPAVDALELYAKYALWVSLAMLVGMIGYYWWKARKGDADPGVDAARAAAIDKEA